MQVGARPFLFSPLPPPLHLVVYGDMLTEKDKRL